MINSDHPNAHVRQEQPRANPSSVQVCVSWGRCIGSRIRRHLWTIHKAPASPPSSTTYYPYALAHRHSCGPQYENTCGARDIPWPFTPSRFVCSIPPFLPPLCTSSAWLVPSYHSSNSAQVRYLRNPFFYRQLHTPLPLYSHELIYLGSFWR